MTAVGHLTDTYSLVETEDAGVQLIQKRLPSQTLRKIIARELGASKWDWREGSAEDQLIALALTANSELALRNGVSLT
jgi:hypothetical protein